MFPMNTPNMYNKPKERPRFFLKEGKYFWLSSLMKTYRKSDQEEYARRLAQSKEMIDNQHNTIEENFNIVDNEQKEETIEL